ncbi:sporulation protein [Halocatena halophila]|uniref:sporulation protein n=1 Tax=Halocatena halophila TaxID=2814576 RepID=UPI002ED57BC6
MKKILTSIGIGAATVDTVLPSTTVTPGTTVDAEISIEGGQAPQKISAIELTIETRYQTDEGYVEAEIGRTRLAESLTIEPDMRDVRSTPIEIPYHTPITIGRVDVWLDTDLEIDMAVDPEDIDQLVVNPTPRMRALFDAAESLGFTLANASCQADPYGRYTSTQSFVQEFEFRPKQGPFVGAVDEIEFVCQPGPDALTAFIEVDRRGSLFSELTDTDERHEQLIITETEPEQLATKLEPIIHDLA